MNSDHNKVQDITFNFTGFGAFLDITKNPTTELIDSLSQWIKENKCESKVGDIRVLNVTADDCKTYIVEIMSNLQKKEAEEPHTKQVLVHMGIIFSFASEFLEGVDDSAEKISLEIHGYNNADFGLPDNNNYCPKNEKINKSFPLEHYFKTIMPVEKICTALESKHKVQLSNDPGRYVCNYIYYTSLSEGYKKGIPSIFVHVPPFKRISKQDQEAFIKDFMKTVQEQLLQEFTN